MKTQRFTRTLILAAVLAVVPSLHLAAQEPGMEPQLPGNPVTRMLSGLNPANWTMPKMSLPSMDRFLPTKQEKDRVITKKNGFVDEVSNTAKSSWRRTKETLNPMRLIPAGFRQDGQTAPAPQPKKQGGFFSSLFSPFPEPEEDDITSSVNDFLKQDPIR